jgi:type II secretory pathway pseudopilin PulG
MPLPKKNHSGFTLVEVMTSVFLIIVSLTAVMAIGFSASRDQYVGRNAVVSSMLAQEGLELARKLRDENWRNGGLNGTTWKDGTIGGTTNLVQDGSYAIDYDGTINAVPNAAGDAGTRIYLDVSGDKNLYTHRSVGGNLPTPYYRIIKAESPSDEKIVLTCTVIFFKPGGGSFTYEAKTELYNWL